MIVHELTRSLYLKYRPFPSSLSEVALQISQLLDSLAIMSSKEESLGKWRTLTKQKMNWQLLLDASLVSAVRLSDLNLTWTRNNTNHIWTQTLNFRFILMDALMPQVIKHTHFRTAVVCEDCFRFGFQRFVGKLHSRLFLFLVFFFFFWIIVSSEELYTRSRDFFGPCCTIIKAHAVSTFRALQLF